MYWMYLIVVVMRRKDDCEASRGSGCLEFGLQRLWR